MLKHKSTQALFIVGIIVVAFFLLRPQAVIIEQKKVRSFDPDFMVLENLVQPITREVRTLSDGSKAECFVIICRAVPTEHEVGPWAPRHVDEGKEQGGLWIKGGHVYDVDGQFINQLDRLYDDPDWQLTREDGSIRRTDTKEAFEAVSRDDVESRYHNHVIACPKEFTEWQNYYTEYVIPVSPRYRSLPTQLQGFGSGREAVGFALNGIKFDPPSPIDALVAIHAIEPYDRAGGHVSPLSGYHYHFSTGQTKQIAQPDDHAPLIGYAMDGFAIYAHLDPSGNTPGELDECSGHYDEIRGYHYHIGAVGDNQVIKAFRGVPGAVSTIKNKSSAAP